MKTAKTILLILLLLLSLATGITKLIQMPEEMELFRGAGFPDWLTLAFGAMQALAGGMLLIQCFQHWAARLLMLSYGIATGVVFANGMMVFGVVSILFIAMCIPFLKPQNT